MSIEVRFCIDGGGFSLDVDLRVPVRGVTALFGPSGCGKTTLLRAIAGLERYRDGVLKVGDMIWQSAGRFVPPHRRALGYVFQEASLFAHLSVRRNLEYGVKRVPREQRKVALEQAVELLGIAPLLDRKPARLSGGERQRVAICRALLPGPGLLLADEATGNLDPDNKTLILDLLFDSVDAHGATLLAVTHDHELLPRFDRVVDFATFRARAGA